MHSRNFTAFFSYTLGVQDGWLACPFSHILAKSTRSLGLSCIPKFFYYVSWRHTQIQARRGKLRI